MNNDVCVVIVTYNAGQELAAVIQRYLSSGAQVLCVDNASRDDTAARARLAGAAVIQLPTNLGYGRAFNSALTTVTAAVVMCANQDLLVEPEATLALAAAVSAAEGHVIAGPGLFARDGSRAETGNLLPRPANHVLELLWGVGGLRNVWPRRAPEWTSGALLAARRGTWNELGGFSAAYFMYVEDVDLFMRLKSIEGALLYLPQVVAVHLGGRRPLSPQMHAHVLSNWASFYLQYFGAGWAILAAIAAIVGGLCRGLLHGVRGVRHEEARAYARMFICGSWLFALRREPQR